VERVLAAGGPDRVAAFAEAPVQTSDAAMRSILPKASDIEEAIRTADWPLFEAVWMLQDHRRGEAARIRSRVVEILSADEHAVALKPALDEQRGKALRLLAATPRDPDDSSGAENGDGRRHRAPVREIGKGREKAIRAGAAKNLLRRIEQEMAEHPEARLGIDWRIFEQEQA
jgi:hypothetical protein